MRKTIWLVTLLVVLLCASVTAGTFYQDLDGDGFGNPLVNITNDTMPIGYVNNSNDCNDSNETIYEELEGYQDLDSDTFGAGIVTNFCMLELPTGYVNNSDDCNDTNNETYQEVELYLDEDQDTFGSNTTLGLMCIGNIIPINTSLTSNDCDDTNPLSFPTIACIPACDTSCNYCNITGSNVTILGGECPEPTKSSGGSSSGSGVCRPTWVCDEWSNCINNQQYRECIDKWNCNSDNNIIETKSCISPKEEVIPTKKEEPVKPKIETEPEIKQVKNNKDLVIGILAIICIVSLFTYGLYKIRNKTPKKPTTKEEIKED